MKSFGTRAAGERLERMRASPRWVGEGFRNVHPVLPGLRDPLAPRPTLGDFLCGGPRRVPGGPLPSVDPRDTGLTAEYAAIRERLGPFDLVMLEIGAFHPSWGDIHLGPANALRAYEFLGGGALLPVHWSTFSLSTHDWDEPGETLLELAGRRNVPPKLQRDLPWPLD
jgi:hypothetical protein